MSKWQQHGDVQLIPIDVIPDDAKSIGTRSVVQEGEMTGHAHRLPMGVPMFQNPAGMFLWIFHGESISRTKNTNRNC